MLLIHGLTGTPTEMRFVGNGLSRAGFSVLGMQLAGHCGDEADLLATGWREWYASVVAAAEHLREQVDHLFVAGLSMGSVLALKLAIDRPDAVDGLGLYGTTFFHDGWATPPIGRLAFLLPLLTRVGIGQAASRPRPNRTASRTSASAIASSVRCFPATARRPALPVSRGPHWPNASVFRCMCVAALVACVHPA